MSDDPTTARTTFPDGHVLGRLWIPALVVVGAVVGANLRYGLGAQLPGLAGTLVANAVGSLALGVLLYEARFAGRLSRETRVLLGTGLLSSFTTYSTFVVDAVTTAPVRALGYVVATYALGFAGVLAGREIARRLAGGEE